MENLITKWLDEHGDPVIRELVHENVRLENENRALKTALHKSLLKMNEVHFDADKGIRILNEQHAKRFEHMNNMYDVDLDYMMSVGRFAWGYRGQQIMGFYVRPIVEKALKEINYDTTRDRERKIFEKYNPLH